jgi:hypothetical protein
MLTACSGVIASGVSMPPVTGCQRRPPDSPTVGAADGFPPARLINAPEDLRKTVSSLIVIEALGAAGFFSSLAALIVAYGGRSPLLDKALWSCVTLTGSLSGAGLTGLVDGRPLGLSCLGLLISVQAIATARHAGRESLETHAAESVDEAPAWWPEFERDFQRYVGQASEGREIG